MSVKGKERASQEEGEEDVEIEEGEAQPEREDSDPHIGDNEDNASSGSEDEQQNVAYTGEETATGVSHASSCGSPSILTQTHGYRSMY
jgi:hypothetical protein